MGKPPPSASFYSVDTTWASSRARVTPDLYQKELMPEPCSHGVPSPPSPADVPHPALLWVLGTLEMEPYADASVLF